MTIDKRFNVKMIDDKGNLVPEKSIVIDTGEAMVGYPAVNDSRNFYYVINSICCVNISTHKIYTFKQLKESGYISLWIKPSFYTKYNNKLRDGVKYQTDPTN